jgi:hypothetical protein
MTDDETIALVEAEIQKFHAKRRAKTICNAANREWRRRYGYSCPVEGEPAKPKQRRTLGELLRSENDGQLLLNEDHNDEPGMWWSKEGWITKDGRLIRGKKLVHG